MSGRADPGQQGLCARHGLRAEAGAGRARRDLRQDHDLHEGEVMMMMMMMMMRR